MHYILDEFELLTFQVREHYFFQSKVTPMSTVCVSSKSNPFKLLCIMGPCYQQPFDDDSIKNAQGSIGDISFT